MRFVDLYKQNKEDVERNLISMWCSDSQTKQQKAYADQIKELIRTELFASEDYMPLVQSMERYKSATTEQEVEAFKLVDKNLWLKTMKPGKYYPPYEHQYMAWKTLCNTTGKKRSMVVTTGTGSGKTECFMLPLVNDLINNPLTNGEHHIEAIFLYPLNALMEDQKQRLQQLLNNTDITFAVYNGNLKESGKKREVSLPNMLASREDLRDNPANILLTNPTMLEYMLLRKNDQCLFTKGHLKWIVIDETHTFTGAGATELAMLIRRVLDAFGVKAEDVRFATSSATIGNGDNIAENEKKLKEFINGISGVDIDNIDLIKGDRPKINVVASNPLSKIQDKLSASDFIRLDELIAEGNTIEEKLNVLDSLCDQGLRAKVHFFYRVPNNGLRVKLDEFQDKTNGVLKLKSFVDKDPNATPSLEIKRCEHCGEYFMVGELYDANKPYDYRAATRNSDNDIFDFTDDSNKQLILFGLVENYSSKIDGNVCVDIDGKSYSIKSVVDPDWNFALNTKLNCPHCGMSVLASSADSDDDVSDDTAVDAITYRISPEYMSRVLSEGILCNLRKSDKNDPAHADDPHSGQQYISFVDSRQAAAQNTFKQNIDVERAWAYSLVYHKLCEKEADIPNEIKALEAETQLLLAQKRFVDYGKKMAELESIKSKNRASLSWEQIFDLLWENNMSEELCRQFANKKSDEEFNDDKVSTLCKQKYILSVLFEQFSKYPRVAAAPETMGLLTSYYPKLDNIKDLPAEVETFNNKFNCHITIEEWRNLMKIFLDRVVRSNQSLYLKSDKFANIDIKRCERFEMSKPPRRPVKMITVGDKAPYSIVPLMLAKLISPSSNSLNDVVSTHKTDIVPVVDKLWDTLLEEKLLQYSESLDSNNNWVVDKDTQKDKARKNYFNPDPQCRQLRLNVTDISFQLIHTASLCDARIRCSDTPVYRPVETLFMGYSPYVIGTSNIEKPIEQEVWIDTDKKGIYPFINGSGFSSDKLTEWASTRRTVLWNNGLWGQFGAFSTKLDKIHAYQEVYVQAEHTAQVDKEVSKQSQELFKEQKINILACSTTMEMGVDLGNLELVMMTSVPPHPSNYKQRAGRSGRNDDTRSVSMTLCSSDAVGIRSLKDPMKYIIQRPMAVPTVDLKCSQVIQRHVNSFLYRESGVFFKTFGTNNLGQELIGFFTRYEFGVKTKNGKAYTDYSIVNEVLPNGITAEIFPKKDKSLGDITGTKYEEFIDYLTNVDGKIIDKLLEGTCLESQNDKVVLKCKEEWERCRQEVEDYANDLGLSYEEERNKYNANNPNNQSFGLIHTPYSTLLMWLFSHTLSQSMIEFLATHRFTPNANMPVDVVEFDINRKKSDYGRKADNPSYSLSQALSQYAPGNSIVKENRVLQVAGIDFIGKQKHKPPFLRYVTDEVDVVLSEQVKKLKNPKKPWGVNNADELILVQPTAFIPDINNSESRKVEKNKYTQVRAQLIDAGDWNLSDTSHHMMIARSNRDSGDAKILYYNVGNGYGYCLCQQCGKMLIESRPVNNSKVKSLPKDMQTGKDKNGTEYHIAIDRFDKKTGQKKLCYGILQRNVIIGNTIQTDYCEIKLRMSPSSPWILDLMGNVQATSLLTTLGILFAQSLVEYLGKEREDVDFLLTPNGHICIYDTNPGGSGYSMQLADSYVMARIIDHSIKTIKQFNHKDEMIDKFTNRYSELIDLDAALTWLEQEQDSWRTLPSNVMNSKYSGARQVSMHNIIESFKKSSGVIFVNPVWNKWIYQDNGGATVDVNNWKNRMLEIIKDHIDNKLKLCLYGPDNMPLPIYSMLASMTSWVDVYTSNATNMDLVFYPLAYVDGRLYFTDEINTTYVDYNWARGNVYCIDISDFSVQMSTFDPFTIPNNNTNFEISEPQFVKTTTRGIVKIVEEKTKNERIPVDSFIDYCSKSQDRIDIIIQDEHLKSVLGMVATLQFVDYFIKKTGRTDFHLSIKNEIYGPVKQTNGITANLLDDYERDGVFTSLIKKWLDTTWNVTDETKQESMFDILSGQPQSLPHWREVSFSCGDHKLIFYPDGGVINEWSLDTTRTTRFYGIANTSTNDDIPVYRKQVIKYGAKYI